MPKSKPLTKEQKAKNAARSRQWHKQNPKKRKNYVLLKTYGITLEQYDYWNNEFNNVCHICEKTCPSNRNLAVDHEHESGIVRGLLCVNCNKGLGNFKDNVELLEKAIQYLKDFQLTKAEVESALNSVQK